MWIWDKTDKNLFSYESFEVVKASFCAFNELFREQKVEKVSKEWWCRRSRRPQVVAKVSLAWAWQIRIVFFIKKILSNKFPKNFLIRVSTVILITSIAEKSWKGYDTKQIWVDIKDIVLKTLIAAESHIVSQLHKNCASQKNCFELFGFDIMLDKKSKVAFWFLTLFSNFNLSV